MLQLIDWQNTSTWHILVVEDELENLEVIAETLEFLGAQVQTARNGKEGLTVLETFMPDFILTDLSMPVMDGWEMRSHIRSDPRFATIPVVALSAHVIAGDKERALEAGFDGYLTKPIDIFTLLDDIRVALGQPAVQKKDVTA